MNATGKQMLDFINHVDNYLRSGDGDWDITSHPDPEAEAAIAAVRALIEAAGKVDKERFAEGIDEASQFGRLHRNVMGGYGLFIEDLEALFSALPDKKKQKEQKFDGTLDDGPDMNEEGAK